MAVKRFIFLGVVLLVFTLVYFGIEIDFNYFENETVPKWKSLSIAGISATLVFYESFSINPNFTFKRLLSNQQLMLGQNLDVSSQEIESALLKLGYILVNSSSNYIQFKSRWKIREPSLHFALMRKDEQVKLTAKPAFKLNLFNMGRSYQQLIPIEKGFA